MKISTGQCKNLIVQEITNSISKILSFGFSQSEAEEALKVSNWKRESKGKQFGEGPNIERAFDCRPLDSQLRAYVITDPTDTIVIHISISGE